MFVSFDCKECISHINDERVFIYELTDSEFGTISNIKVSVCADTNNFDVGCWIVVIQEYSKRNLNVAANLAIALAWYCKQMPVFSIQDIINFNKEHSPLFLQHEEDLQKYLLLL